LCFEQFALGAGSDQVFYTAAAQYTAAKAPKNASLATEVQDKHFTALPSELANDVQVYSKA
jgi:hypothetical protein